MGALPGKNSRKSVITDFILREVAIASSLMVSRGNKNRPTVHLGRRREPLKQIEPYTRNQIHVQIQSVVSERIARGSNVKPDDPCLFVYSTH